MSQHSQHRSMLQDAAQGTEKGLKGREGRMKRGPSPLQMVPYNHLLQLHDVGVPKLQEQGDLPQAADGHSCREQQLSCTTASSRGWGCSCPPQELPPLQLTHSSITVFLIVHPHLLQCHGLICQGVPGPVWKSSTGHVLSTKRQTLVLS